MRMQSGTLLYIHGFWWELHCLIFSGWHNGKRFVCQAPFPMFVLAQGFALPDSQDMRNQCRNHLKVSKCRPHPRGVWAHATLQDDRSPEVLLHCSTATMTVADRSVFLLPAPTCNTVSNVRVMHRYIDIYIFLIILQERRMRNLRPNPEAAPRGSLSDSVESHGRPLRATWPGADPTLCLRFSWALALDPKEVGFVFRLLCKFLCVTTTFMLSHGGGLHPNQGDHFFCFCSGWSYFPGIVTGQQHAVESKPVST